MSGINLQSLSKLISEKTGKKVTFNKIEKIGSGFHSDGFKVSSEDNRSFFLKCVKVNDIGFEFPERQISSFMVGHAMSKRAGNNPAPIGVVVTSEGKEVLLPEIDHSTKVYHIQEFGHKNSISYSKIIEKNILKKAVDGEDRGQLEKIADILVKIHSIKYPSSDKKELTAVYDDGIRSILTNPELSITFLSKFPNDYEILDLEGQKEMISLMYENIKAWVGRYDRLTALHGDFWGSNIFFGEENKCWIIDFSRIPWGDPAIDVGWFISEYLWYYHLTGNQYFRELAETWLSIYEKKSGDKELRRAMPLVIGWLAIARTSPVFSPVINVPAAKKFVLHVIDILRKKEFFWND